MKLNSSLSELEADNEMSSSSLIARAGQIMAVIITLGLVAMIASILVSESLSGDAAQINQAGLLRMHAMRISREQLIQQNHTQQNTADQQMQIEVTNFDQQLNLLFVNGLVNARKQKIIDDQCLQIIKQWQVIKDSLNQTEPLAFDHFVASINQLVLHLQSASEQKLQVLRTIQGGSLFSVLIVAFVVLLKLHRSFILPLKQLVKVAIEVGKGNFDYRAEYQGRNELGLLASALNRMSKELNSTYRDFELRVEQQTEKLTHSNHSLDFLYRTARHLSAHSFSHSIDKITYELESILTIGEIQIELTDFSKTNHLSIDIHEKYMHEICVISHRFALRKQSKVFGYVYWKLPRTASVYQWQTLILQAFTDIIATAIELENQRNSENRLLIMEERAVIARELHDSLAQSLSYLKLQMSLLAKQMSKQREQAEIDLTMTDIKSGLNNAYRQLRELLTTFRLKVEDVSIEHALINTVNEFSAKSKHPIELKIDIPFNLMSASQEIHLLQIIREALSNIQRHAKATHALVKIYYAEQKIQVDISDNGVGFNPKIPRDGHFGLCIMQQRAESLNSSIAFTGLTQGTLLHFQFKPHQG